jgi:ABC-type multidrug transport system fused ATPase/permease subunit
MAFNGVIIFAISLSIFAALRPYLLKQTVDGYIATEEQGLLLYVVLMGIVIRSVFILLRVLGKLACQDIVKTFERNCFNILSFRMKYFDHVPVVTVTRSVSILNLLLEFLVKVYS